MISGSKNLVYLSRGTRTYASKPVIAWARGRWEFEFILKGRARPSGIDCPPGDLDKPRLYIFHPDSPHGWTDEEGAFSEIFVIQFREVPEELGEIITPKKPILTELDPTELRKISNRTQEVWDAAAANSTRASLKIQQLLVEMTLLAVGQKDEAGLRLAPANKVSRAINWLEENLNENPSVEDAARAVGVSTSHLRRLFAEAGKTSPQAELTRLKLEAAQRCLLAGWKQESIAQFLGFSEASAFARAFRDGYGQPPGAWLAQNKQPAKAGRAT